MLRKRIVDEGTPHGNCLRARTSTRPGCAHVSDHARLHV